MKNLIFFYVFSPHSEVIKRWTDGNKGDGCKQSTGGVWCGSMHCFFFFFSSFSYTHTHIHIHTR